ncbi:hypothetical protein [Actinoplanes sp. L3-i22]|uniref:DUF6891 domain-containing protein n=1 Tax=Actinoplanes sp. L3-i22 TaxID=2836373 RepID=UPI001C74B49B|nr:hypothetical protein [Actinoplanes sp. L3-i22]BCY06781.1 hypothetical protein L3i22_018690 [Actinoplanes sp. L3-i22]
MIDEAREHIANVVARGRVDCLTIVDDTVEYLHGEGDPAEIRALAWQLAGPAFEAHLAAQAGWPERTDSDRVTAAFRALDAAGIVAREEFACCRNCGVTEIRDEASTGRGYAFYHLQDAEGAARGEGLHIAFGPFAGSASASEEIGAEVAAALRAEGLDVSWDGSAGRRISVRMAWAQRRHGRMAAYLTESPAASPVIEVEVIRGRAVPGLGGPTPAVQLERLVLPWLPAGVTVRLTSPGEASASPGGVSASPGGASAEVHREFDRLVGGDGRRVSRFAALRLLDPSAGSEPGDAEPALLDVTFQSMPSGPRESQARPLTLPETLDVLRRLPTGTNSWLAAGSRSDELVQMRWEDGQLWLETPDVAISASIGKYATLAEAEQVLTILAEQDRVAIRELPDVITKPW